MIRHFVFAAALAAVTIVAFATLEPTPAQAGVAKKRVMKLTASVSELSTSGRRVAVAVHRDSCVRVRVWNPTRRTAFGAQKAACGARISFDQLQLVGTRLAWVERGGGNTTEEILASASPARGAQTELAHLTHGTDSGGGEHLGPVIGTQSGRDFHIYSNSYEVCFAPGDDVDDFDFCTPEDVPIGASQNERVVFGARIDLHTSGSSRTVLAGAEALGLIATDARRIAIRTGFVTPVSYSADRAADPASTLSIRDSDGAELSSFELPAGVFRGALFSGDNLLVIRNRSLEAYDVATGERVATHRLPGPPKSGRVEYRLTGTRNDLVTYLRGSRGHVIRLSDGASVAFRRVEDIEISSSGVYYSTNRAGAEKPGRVVFLPTKLAETLVK